ncbi:hypothetical protein ABPG72_013305 [Tetrahymena utriculariae]
MSSFTSKTKQKEVQILQQNHYQTTKNNFEAIILSFNRVLYLLGFRDFLIKNELSIVGQSFQDKPFDLEVEFDILLYTMLNLKLIPGLSECDQLHQLQQNIYHLYKSLNQPFVEEIFQLSRLSIKRDPSAKKQYLKLKKEYPLKFLLQQQQVNSQQNDHYMLDTETNAKLGQDIQQDKILESVKQFAYHQNVANQLIEDLRTGKINENQYNYNLCKLGILDKNEYDKLMKKYQAKSAQQHKELNKQDMDIEEEDQTKQNDKTNQSQIQTQKKLEIHQLNDEYRKFTMSEQEYKINLITIEQKYKNMN